jgi:CBS domain-containing protein
MTRAPAACGPDTPLAEVARLMVEHDCGSIPVVDGAIHDKPVGVVTDRDIICRTVAQRKNPLDLSASDVMSSPCVTVSSEEMLDEVIRLMEERQIRRVVVIDSAGEICGIVAQADVARHGSREETGEVVKAVSAPVAEHP